jgi:type III pantothenate kinase
MILAVDIGNTHIVTGCIEGLEIKNIFRMATQQARTEHEYAVSMKQILDFNGIKNTDFEGAVMSSVVPPLTATMKTAIKILTGHTPIVVEASIKTGLNILIDNPAALGSDLVAAGVAARYSYKPPIIIFDMGTATTISVIDENSNFLGGAIVPGVAVSLNALASRTSQLPMVPIEAPRRCIGTNTISSMQSGAVYGNAALMDGMIDRIEEELGCSATVVATGGLAKKIIPYCRHKIILDEDLLLRGLAIIYDKNKQKVKK